MLPEQVHIELGSGRSETDPGRRRAALLASAAGQLAKLLTDGAEARHPAQAVRPLRVLRVRAGLRGRVARRRLARLRRRRPRRRSPDAPAGRRRRRSPRWRRRLDHQVDGLDPARRDTFVRQAAPPGPGPPRSRRASRRSSCSPHRPTPITPRSSTTLDAPDPIGFAALPAPDDGDVFLDFEGHPFWQADVGLFFLFGLIERSPAGEWEFTAFWAHDKAEEARRRRRSSTTSPPASCSSRTCTCTTTTTPNGRRWSGWSTEHGVAELELEPLIATGLFVDLLPIVTGAMQVGVESYGLKHIERLTDYERGHDIDRGAGAVVEYEHWMRVATTRPVSIGSPRYNEDDVRATLALRDWLVTHRPADVPWRAAVLGQGRARCRARRPHRGAARVRARHGRAPDGRPARLLAPRAPGGRRRRVSPVDGRRARPVRVAVGDHPVDVPGLRDRSAEQNGKPTKWPWARFTFPPQPIDVDIRAGSKLIVAVERAGVGVLRGRAIDAEAGDVGGDVGRRRRGRRACTRRRSSTTSGSTRARS